MKITIKNLVMIPFKLTITLRNTIISSFVWALIYKKLNMILCIQLEKKLDIKIIVNPIIYSLIK